MMTSPVEAQVNISVNIGSQPAWGPSGYQHVEYYYLPDIESYYYVPRHQFVYLSNGRWVFSASLPSRYRDYDLYRGYKVVINRHRAYENYERDREEYGDYRDYDNHQKVIRYGDQPRYGDRRRNSEDHEDDHEHGEHGNKGGGHGHHDD
ncbi:MAG: hypothetical protein KKE39_06910 [Bacteroidetes bacterium]|nr:hypothetical protein [Bacteroidota bacterium]MBU1371664.1 hypothetical protein [Bacteroidota bacterium]MBU1486240.1 hypothetical protein [Bacteroidota bacterium]MBU1762163.1 hypothetical protein [Bacteroidota bacterium]MBU2266582.1 hypothetical protein [Bacteroidota bacterium]